MNTLTAAIPHARTLTAAAGLALAAAAYAQPASTDLGALPAGETFVPGIAVNGAGIVWYRFSVPDLTDASSEYLDIATIAAAGDSEIGLYDSAGNLVASDDDDGASVRSALSLGAAFPARPLAGGVAHNGRDAELAAGVYYLSVSNFPTTHNATNWDVFSTSTANNTFDLSLTRGSVPPGPADRYYESPDAGDFPALAQIPAGSGTLGSIQGRISPGGDVDMYAITICDASVFSATTQGDTTMDTQLFLFNADGTGIAHNDDSPPGGLGLQSTISAALIPGPGVYYLAVTGYNNDPQDASGATLWANSPFNTERAPDGPGAANPLAAWSGAGATGSYIITFTGACFPDTACAVCAADYDQSGGVDGDDIGAFFADWTAGTDCADVDESGGVDGDDIGFFFARWTAGGCD